MTVTSDIFMYYVYTPRTSDKVAFVKTGSKQMLAMEKTGAAVRILRSKILNFKLCPTKRDGAMF